MLGVSRRTVLAVIGILIASGTTFGSPSPASATPAPVPLFLTSVNTGAGSAPVAVAVTPNGARAYIANRDNGTISILNTASNTITTPITLPAGAAPTSLAITPSGAHAYVTNRDANTVSVITTADDTVSAPITGFAAPQGIAITPDGTRAYVTNSVANTVSVINTATNAISATIIGFAAPQGIAITPDGAHAYVTNRDANTVSVINTDTNAISATITLPTGAAPQGIAITPDGTRAYVTNSVANTVSVINTATNAISATIIGFAAPQSIAISSNGSYAYVSFGSAGLGTIDTRTNTVVGVTETRADGIIGIAVSPDGGRIYGAGSVGNAVSVLSTGERVSCNHSYPWPSGSGTVANPYRVASSDDLNAVRNCPSSAFIQTQNISLSGDWTPIGTTAVSFTGDYDGDGFSITGLRLIEASLPSGEPAGLFGRAQGAAIRDLRISGGQAVVARGDTGLLVGSCEECQISSVEITGSVTGAATNVGGLAGRLSGETSIVSQSSSAAAVVGELRTGGLIGLVTMGAIVSDTCATGSVTGTRRVGGLVGDAAVSALLFQTCATGSVTGTRYVGGLVGWLAGGDDRDMPVPGQVAFIYRSFASGNVSATDSVRASAGGLAGANSSTIVDPTDPQDVAIMDSYATGSVTGVGVVGGLIGESGDNGITKNSYAVGAVTGAANNSTGGFEGNAAVLVEQWYASTYWNIETTGRTFGVGGSGAVATGLNLATITGLTSAQMRSSSSFSGWDFTTVWGYQCGVSTTPELRWANPLATETSAGSCPAPNPGPSTPSSPTDSPAAEKPVNETPAPPASQSDTAFPPGSASMLIGGRPVAVQQTTRRRGQGIELKAGPVIFQLRSQTPSGRNVPTSPDGALVIARSGTLPITGNGLLVGSLLTQSLNSDPINLGTTRVKRDGRVASETEVPGSVPKGDHTLTLTGITKDGEPFTLAIGVVVTSPAAALGASPIITTTPSKLSPGGHVKVTATGVQARCAVTFTLDNMKARTTANARGVAVVTLTVPSSTKRTLLLLTKVSGKGCKPLELTRKLNR